MKRSTGILSFKGAYAYSIVGVSLVLFLLGMTGFVITHSYKLEKFVKENVVMSVMLEDSIAQSDISRLQQKISAHPYVKTAIYISPQEAGARLKSETGEDFTDILTSSPLPPSFDVFLKSEYASETQMMELASFISKEEGIADVYYQKGMLEELNENRNKLSLILLAFAGLIFLLAFGLINNMVRLTIYSKRFLIRTMLLVGASRGFIRRPFLWQALMLGVVSSLLAFIGLEMVLQVIYRQIPDLAALSDNTLTIILFVTLVAIGAFIALICTFFAVNRFIRMKTDYLFR